MTIETPIEDLPLWTRALRAAGLVSEDPRRREGDPLEALHRHWQDLSHEDRLRFLRGISQEAIPLDDLHRIWQRLPHPDRLRFLQGIRTP
jgi:hypothetical protein